MQKRSSKYILVLTGVLIIQFTNTLFGQSEISGKLKLDSTWNPVIYLSLISDFEHLNSMSNKMIIDKTEIDNQGEFNFGTDYLPANTYIYRLHISKKGDPPASLIIGGTDENHLFLITNKSSSISITSTDSNSLFGSLIIESSSQSHLLHEINKMVLFADTSSFNSSSLKRELMGNALGEQLRQFADTCSYPLVALYTLYKTDFEENISENPSFYNRFLEKWSAEESPYFEEFRGKAQVRSNQSDYSLLYGFTGLTLGLCIMFLFMKKQHTKPPGKIQELTLQEKKVFKLLNEEKSNKEISEELNISLSTVKSHVNNIFSKLNIKSRREVSKFSPI